MSIELLSQISTCIIRLFDIIVFCLVNKFDDDDIYIEPP